MEQKDLDNLSKKLTEQLRIDFNDSTIECYCECTLLNYNNRIFMTMSIGRDEKVKVDPKVSFSIDAHQEISQLHNINVEDDLIRMFKYEVQGPYNNALRTLKFKMIKLDNE